MYQPIEIERSDIIIMPNYDVISEEGSFRLHEWK